MLGFFKKRRARRLGREFGALITQRVEDHIAGRVQPARERFMDVFRDRLKTVFDQPEHDPRTVTQVEYEVFQENLGNFLGEMRAELSVRLYRYDEAIQAADLQGQCDDYIGQRIADIQNQMQTEAAALVLEMVGQIEARR